MATATDTFHRVAATISGALVMLGERLALGRAFRAHTPSLPTLFTDEPRFCPTVPLRRQASS